MSLCADLYALETLKGGITVTQKGGAGLSLIGK